MQFCICFVFHIEHPGPGPHPGSTSRGQDPGPARESLAGFKGSGPGPAGRPGVTVRVPVKSWTSNSRYNVLGELLVRNARHTGSTCCQCDERSEVLPVTRNFASRLQPGHADGQEKAGGRWDSDSNESGSKSRSPKCGPGLRNITLPQRSAGLVL